MGRYADVIKKHGRSASWRALRPVSTENLEALKRRWPDLPADYLDFLAEVGFLDIGHGAYTVYEGPTPPEDIYDPQTASQFRGILLVGGDMSGYIIGFEPKRRELVEIDGMCQEVVPLGMTFEEFIRVRIAKLSAE